MSTLPHLPGDFDALLGGGFFVPNSYPMQAQPTGVATNDAAVNDGGGYNGPGASRRFLGEPFAVFLGLILLLVGLKWMGEKPDTLGGANPAHLRVGGYNVFAIAIIAGLSNVIWAVIANRSRIPGIKEFATAASS